MPRKIIKILSLLLCFCLFFEQVGFAQGAAQLDIASHLTKLRNSLIQDKFRPLHLRYLQYNPQENNFQLYLDRGTLKNPSSQEIEDTTKILLNYFFIGVALPNDIFWVNLRPDTEDNIIDDRLAQTDVGRIMLETDLQLKKDTAKFTSPETPEGRKYWDKLYKKAGEIFGSQNITIPTLTRPWIVPDEIIISETLDSAYIYKATLKVMLEQDYLKGSAVYNFENERLKELNEYSSQLIREIIIPKLTKEVNSSKRYASLRQVYYSLIMAQWFKVKFQGEQGKYYGLINSQNLQNLNSKEPWLKTTYFKEYQKSFKDGEYNIQEPVYTPTGQVIRSYFSGGMQIMLKEFPQMGQKIYNKTGTHISRIPIANSAIVKPDIVMGVEVEATNTIGKLGEIKIKEVSSPMLAKKQAIDQLDQLVNAIQQGKYQQGAVINLRNLPSGVEVILVGDLHTRLDNLKKILNKNNNLNKIQKGEAVLVILGDAVHSSGYELEKMDSSVEIMQFIMDLKIKNPNNVYYVLGNHDYLSPFCFKGGVMQGIVYRDKLKELYGENYIVTYENFIKVSPLMVMGNGFIAIHGGPIKDASLDEIQNVDVANEDSFIVQQAEWGRYNDSNPLSPYYYGRDDVCEFLNRMGQPESQLIVGHSPRKDGNWHWQLLPNLHIVFAGHNRVGYAVVQNEEISFIEVTNNSAQLGLRRDQEEEIPIDEQVLIPKQTGKIYLKPQQRVEIDYSDSGPIHIILASRTGSEVKLGVYNYRDLPVRFKNLGLNLTVEYFIVEEGSEIPIESVGFKGLRNGETVDIGRNNPGRFTLNTFISRNHIRIQRKDNTVILEDLNSTNGTIVEWDNVSSSSVSISNNTKMGGIDFRFLPIVTQAMSNLSANISSSAINNLISINIDKEWLEIERMAGSGITPSSQRLKEYIQTSCAQGNITQDRDKILLCISDILRFQEERCDSTDATLRDILVVLESMSNTQELKQVFLGKII
ncbi:MAG: metallophosphoesterase [Candidatus Omnitrophota bacterium]|nr:metallophosphoesterase [Candidatus Omnitrophota bacterium]